MNLSYPSDFLTNVQTVLDSAMQLEQQDVVLYFPPTLQAVSGSATLGYPAGSDWSQSVWSAGNPQPLHSQQSNNPYGDGLSYMQVESTGIIQMIIYPNPTRFNGIFPAGNRLVDGQIVTRGYVSDLPAVLNCTHIETYLSAGTAHYKYKLDGDPVMPGTLVPNRYFYALFKRL